MGVTGTGSLPLLSGGTQNVKRSSFLKLTVTSNASQGGGASQSAPPPAVIAAGSQARHRWCSKPNR